MHYVLSSYRFPPYFQYHINTLTLRARVKHRLFLAHRKPQHPLLSQLADSILLPRGFKVASTEVLAPPVFP